MPHSKELSREFSTDKLKAGGIKEGELGVVTFFGGFIVKCIPWEQRSSHKPRSASHRMYYLSCITQPATQSSQTRAKHEMSYGSSGHQLPTSVCFLSCSLSGFLFLSFWPAVLPCSKQVPLSAEWRLPFLWPQPPIPSHLSNRRSTHFLSKVDMSRYSWQNLTQE